MSVADFLTTMKANESQYGIEIQSFPDDFFSVVSFESIRDQLCDDFCFQITLLCEESIEPNTIIGKEVSLGMLWSLADRTITGICTDLFAAGNDHQGNHYILELSSDFNRLKHSQHNRIFTGVPVEDIIKSVFKKANYPSEKLAVNASGPTLDMVVQYNESDYHFVTRLMRKYGFVYSYIESNNKTKLMICNSSDELAKASEHISLSYQAPTGQVRSFESIFAISKQAKLTTQSVAFNDYNYLAPSNLSVSQQNTTSIAGFGEDNRYGENYKSVSDGEHLAEVLQQSYDCQREMVIIDTDCRALRPGMRVTIENSSNSDDTYLVVSVVHQGSQSASVNYGSKIKGLTYKNQAILLKMGVTYKAPLINHLSKNLTFNATIEQEIDDTGCYLVKFPFNQNGEGEQSKPIRLMQPYGGNGHGMHFPFTKGTEVLIAGENGDIDRPIILGALYNSETPNPVTSANASENKLVTRAGHTLLMDDKLGEEKISLSTKDENNQLLLDASNGAHQAILRSKQGEVTVQAKETLSFITEGDHVVTAAKNMTTSADGDISVQTREGGIELIAAEALTLKAEANIQLESNVGNSEFTAQENMTLKAKQDITLYTQNGNLSLQAQEGDLSLNSSANVTIKSTDNGNIKLSQGQGSIALDTGGNLTVDANNINLNAENIVVNGNALTNN